MNETLTYSNQALRNRSLFYIYNDIHFFVEDKNKEYEYEIFLENLIDKNLSYKIFGLGGKEQVLYHFHDVGPVRDKITNVYILDLDFDDYLEKMNINSHIIYLERYNIESYFLCEQSVYDFIRLKLKKTKKSSKELFDFNIWYKQTLESFKDIFFLYMIIQKYNYGIPNVADSIYCKIDDCGKVVLGYYQNLFNQILTRNPSFPIETELLLLNQEYSEKLPNIICGKHMIESLYLHIKKSNNTRNRISSEELRSFLLSNFDIKPFQFIKHRIQGIMPSSTT